MNVELSAPHHRQQTRAFAVDSVVRLGDVSAPDVYVTVVLHDRQYNLSHGDTALIPAGTTAMFNLFRKSFGAADSFSAVLVLP